MASVRPTGDVSATGGWTTFGSGASQAARLADLSDATGMILNYPDTGEILYELGDPASVDAAQPVYLKMRATSGLSPAGALLSLIDQADAETVCSNLFGITVDGFTFTEYSYTLSGSEKALLNNLSALRVKVSDVVWTGPSGGEWFSVSEIWLEYSESGGGGGARIYRLPLVGAG